MDTQEQCNLLQDLQEESSEGADGQGSRLEQREGEEQGYRIDKFVMRARLVQFECDHSLMIY